METETVKSVVDLLSSGGSAALLFVAWIAYGTFARLKQTGEHIKAMHDAILAVQPKVEKALQDLDSINERLARQEFQLAQVVSQHPQRKTVGEYRA